MTSDQTFVNQTIDLTGNAYTRCDFHNCTLVGSSGHLAVCRVFGGSFTAVKVRARNCWFAGVTWRRDCPAPTFRELIDCDFMS